MSPASVLLFATPPTRLSSCHIVASLRRRFLHPRRNDAAQVCCGTATRRFQALSTQFVNYSGGQARRLRALPRRRCSLLPPPPHHPLLLLATGSRLFVITHNATRPRHAVASQLARRGVQVRTRRMTTTVAVVHSVDAVLRGPGERGRGHHGRVSNRGVPGSERRERRLPYRQPGPHRRARGAWRARRGRCRGCQQAPPATRVRATCVSISASPAPPWRPSCRDIGDEEFRQWHPDPGIGAVVVSFDSSFNYRKLAIASLYAQHGLPLIVRCRSLLALACRARAEPARCGSGDEPGCGRCDRPVPDAGHREHRARPRGAVCVDSARHDARRSVECLRCRRWRAAGEQ